MTASKSWIYLHALSTYFLDPFLLDFFLISSENSHLCTRIITRHLWLLHCGSLQGFTKHFRIFTWFQHGSRTFSRHACYRWVLPEAFMCLLLTVCSFRFHPPFSVFVLNQSAYLTWHVTWFIYWKNFPFIDWNNCDLLCRQITWLSVWGVSILHPSVCHLQPIWVSVWRHFCF